MMNKALEYDDFIKDSDWIAKSAFQPMYVRINGREYKIQDWYPDCDQYSFDSDSGEWEECNNKIVFEI